MYISGSIKLKKYLGIPIVAYWVKNWYCLCEDEGIIPGMVRWVKDQALPQAAA